MRNNIQKKAFLSVCLFLLAGFNSIGFCQSSLFGSSSEAYSELLKGNLFSISTPNSPVEHYLYAYQTTLKLLLYEDVNQDEFERIIDNALNSYDSNKPTPILNYFNADTRLLACLGYYKFDKQIDAGWQLRQAYRIAQKLRENNPNYYPILKTLGLLEILIGSVPEKYQWLLSLAGLHGTVNTGQDYLCKIIDSNNELTHETALLYLLSNAYILGDNTEKFDSKIDIQSDNPLNRLIKAAIWSKTSNGQKIIELAEHLDSDKDFAQIKYLIADAYLQSGQYRKAIELFESFVNSYSGMSNKKDAFFKLYLCHSFIKSRTSEKFRELAKIQPAISTSDRNAQSLLDEELNLEMLKLRFATDGGFYEIANNLITNVPLKSKKDSIELYYRKARLEHKLGNVNSALLNYKLTIDITSTETWYFAPNSALQLGLIYETKTEFDSANYFYQKALSYKHHIYKTSIDAKCEAGLNRIEAVLSD